MGQTDDGESCVSNARFPAPVAQRLRGLVLDAAGELANDAEQYCQYL